MANRSTSVINNLKSKDERKRRRAVRELFEIDDENNLSAFIPLLDDKDSWYRSKAIDAFRTWSIRKNVSDLINFGRLINVNVHSLSNIDDLKKFVNANPSRKLIIDVSRDFLIKDDFNSYLEELSKMTQTSILLAIQSGINKNSLKKQISFFKNVKPIIALTKLDETPIGAEEFSILAEINSKIGLLSASKNIIDAIAFTKDEILAQYMKEM